MAQAVRRELREETGLDVEPLEIIGVFERILRDRGRGKRGRVRYHFVVVDYICKVRKPRRGDRGLAGKPARLRAASDVTSARWVLPDDLSSYKLTPQAHEVILEAFLRVHERE